MEVPTLQFDLRIFLQADSRPAVYPPILHHVSLDIARRRRCSRCVRQTERNVQEVLEIGVLSNHAQVQKRIS